jgi:hypothetical protein
MHHRPPFGSDVCFLGRPRFAAAVLLLFQGAAARFCRKVHPLPALPVALGLPSHRLGAACKRRSKPIKEHAVTSTGTGCCDEIPCRYGPARTP